MSHESLKLINRIDEIQSILKAKNEEERILVKELSILWQKQRELMFGATAANDE